MPFSTSGKNCMLDSWSSTETGDPVTHASLHSDIPGDSGSDEIAGGSPAYARVAVTFDPAASGAIDKNVTDPVFDVPGSTTVFYVGFWTASSGGTFLGYAPINGGTVEGYATVLGSGDVFTSYAHGLVNTDRIALRAPPNGALPTGAVATTLYYVIAVTTDTFQISLTSGGSAVALGDGECYFQKVIGETFASQGTLTFDTGTFALN